MTTIPYIITGNNENHPCLIEVISYKNITACNNADNPYDYNGDEEIEFAILHTDGSYWEEMDMNLTNKEVTAIEKVISDFFANTGTEG